MPVKMPHIHLLNIVIAFGILCILLLMIALHQGGQLRISVHSKLQHRSHLLIRNPTESLTYSLQLDHKLQVNNVNYTKRWNYYQQVMQGKVIYHTPKRVVDDNPNVTYPNPHNFSYVINEETLCDDSLFMLVYVHSAPSHYKRRLSIRETWAHQKWLKELRFRIIFFLGIPSDNVTLQSAIHFESDLYHDIVQENYIDAYRNLTYKGISALKWVANYCHSVRWVLKTDDDIMVNTFLLFSHLNSLSVHGFAPKRCIMCLVWGHMPVLRTGKWQVATSDFSGDFFPKYCSGSAFLFTPDIIADMYNISLFTPFFWVDDVYITGYLPKAIGVQHQSMASLYVFKQEQLLERMLNKTDTAVFGHVRKINLMHRLWKEIIPMMMHTPAARIIKRAEQKWKT